MTADLTAARIRAAQNKLINLGLSTDFGLPWLNLLEWHAERVATLEASEAASWSAGATRQGDILPAQLRELVEAVEGYEPESTADAKSDLRRDMHAGILDILNTHASATVIADWAATLAESYLRPLQATVEEQQEALSANLEHRLHLIERNAELSHQVRARDKRITALQKTVDELESASPVSAGASVAEYKAQRWIPVDNTEQGRSELKSDLLAADQAVADYERRNNPEPSPEMREVPAQEAREGDLVFRRGVVAHTFAGGVSVDFEGVRIQFPISSPSLTFTRPVIPLPTKPGAVIRCEIAAIGSQSVIAEAHPYTHRTDDVFWNVMGESSSYKSSDITRLITVLDDGQDQ